MIKEILGIILIVLGLVFAGYLVDSEKQDLEENACYTIAYTNGSYKRHGEKVKYSFRFNGVNYNGVSHYKIDSLRTINGRYFLKFSSVDPRNKVFMEDLPVPDSIKAAPYSGWKRLPVSAEL